ncbi:MAG: hypothetical protein GY801_46685 [bacterium]|nr:hypothetical protein [bacterium]
MIRGFHIERPPAFVCRRHALLEHAHDEGWDQPMMEAATLGIQLLAPQHSAYTSYLDASVARMIPARQIPACFHWSDGLHKLFEGAEWWEPDEETAAAYLHHIIHAAPAGQILSARTRILENFTWKKATTRLLNILEDIPQKSPPGSRWINLWTRFSP